MTTATDQKERKRLERERKQRFAEKEAERRTDDGQYKLKEVPATGSEFCRWALYQTEAGHAIQPAENIALASASLFAELKRTAPRPAPAVQEEAVRMIARRGTEYVVTERGTVKGVPVFESRRPGQRWSKLAGAELWESFMLGPGHEGEAFSKAPDDAVYAALRDVCSFHRVKGAALRQLNDSTARALLLRAGLDVDEASLPHPNGMVTR